MPHADGAKRPDWDRVEPLLQTCLELPPEERDAYLDENCGADTAAWVRRLLAAEAEHTSFLRPLDATPDTDPGTRIGPWRLLEKIGEGGMGVVWRGERADGAFEKRVAMKLLKVGMRQPGLERRFHTEVQVLATLEHASIARFLDGGRSENGVPFLVLEFVDGKPIDAWCDDGRLAIRARVELFLSVCDAVQHAHERGVLHRDLKPGNVLVGADGVPRLLDFGIAKVVGEMEGLDDLELTATGQRLYSPRYASPEQVRGDATSATSDTYSLGVMLYELLTGRAPYSLTKVSRFELERAALETEARRPSLAVDEGADEEGRDLPTWTLRGLHGQGEHRALLRGDLDWILMTALRKEPERRYATVRDLADDLRRWLERRPVLARPESVTYRARRFAQRNRALVTATLAVLVALCVGLGLALSAGADARRASEENLRTAYRSALSAAAGGLREGDVTLAREALDAQPVELRGWEWRHLNARVDGSRAFFPEAESLVEGTGLAVSGDGTWAVVSGAELAWLDLRADDLRARTPPPTKAAANGVALHPEHGRVAVAANFGVPHDFPNAPSSPAIGFLDPEARDYASLQVDFDANPTDVAWSPDGRLFAWAQADGVVVLRDDVTRAEVARWRAHDPGAAALAFSPEGSLLATVSWDETAKLWSVPSAELVATLEGHTRRVTDAAWTSDGMRLVTTSSDGTVGVWDTGTGRRLAVHRFHRGVVNGVVILPGDEEVVTVGFGGDVLRWELGSGVVRGRYLGHEGEVVDVAAFGQELVTAGHDGTRLWSVDRSDVPTASVCEFTRSLLVGPAGESLWNWAADGVLHRFAFDGRELETRALPFPSGARVGHRFGLAVLGDTVFVRNLEAEGYVLRDLESGQIVHRSPRPSHDDDLFSMLATARHDRLVLIAPTSLVLDPRTGAERPLDIPAPLPPAPGQRPAACLSPHEAFVATGQPDAVRLWQLPGGTLERTIPLQGEPSIVHALAFSPDADRIFVPRTDDLVVLDLEDGSQRLLRAVGQPRSVALHPTEPRFAVGDQAGHVTLFDAERLEPMVRLGRHTGPVHGLVFSPDGSTLVSAGSEGNVRFWTTD